MSEVASIMRSLGAVENSGFYDVETAHGPLQWNIRLGRSKFAHVAVDRISTGQDAPPHARQWAESTLWPILRAGVDRAGKRHEWVVYTLPACVGAYSQAHVYQEDLERVLRLWVPQETRWQVEALDTEQRTA